MLRDPLTSPSPVTFRESLVFALGLAGLIGLQLVATDSTYLFQKYFWLDELYTYTLIGDADWGHALRALQGGVETNPPSLHLATLAFSKLMNSTPEVALRGFALISVVLALVGIYSVLREGYSVLVAVGATLAVWSHPMILDHAFEARY